MSHSRIRYCPTDSNSAGRPAAERNASSDRSPPCEDRRCHLKFEPSSPHSDQIKWRMGRGIFRVLTRQPKGIEQGKHKAGISTTGWRGSRQQRIGGTMSTRSWGVMVDTAAVGKSINLRFRNVPSPSPDQPSPLHSGLIRASRHQGSTMAVSRTWTGRLSSLPAECKPPVSRKVFSSEGSE